jgi:hypothetical protein
MDAKSQLCYRGKVTVASFESFSGFATGTFESKMRRSITAVLHSVKESVSVELLAVTKE